MWLRTLLSILAVVLLAILAFTKGPLKAAFAPDDAAQEAVAEKTDGDRQVVLTERFAVREGGHLRVSVGDADVSVEAGASDEVRVEIIVEGRDAERNREYYERQHFSVYEDGGSVYVETDAEHNDHFGGWRDRPDIEVIITTPERFNADLRTSDGDLRLDRMDGDLSMRTSDGDVHANALTGALADIRTSDGDLRIGAVASEEVSFQTSDGDVMIDAVSARSISIRTSDGDIRVQAIEGRDEIDVQTSDGDISAEAVAGAVFTAKTSDGDLRLGTLTATRSRLSVSDGSINVDRVEGALEATGGDADIRVGLLSAAPVRLRTSDGDISISAPSDLRADLQLDGDNVRVSSDFDFSGTLEEESAHGSINGGGPVLEARASSGDVSLRVN